MKRAVSGISRAANVNHSDSGVGAEYGGDAEEGHVFSVGVGFCGGGR